ncbi:hypothetical protein OG802_19020 [Streptomyces sp. NBC_00704]|uniref:hypothetical protein n=1 Tax=Streptomyces sp. NBC_00704 TaxID=2975809 RepID=UPI002E3447A5|nr:hypothetical protein [Streptomyces sp. NBC_00704]
MSELYGTDRPTAQDVPEQQFQEAAGWETAEFGEPEEPAVIKVNPGSSASVAIPASDLKV